MLSGQLLETADGNASVYVCVYIYIYNFVDTTDDRTIRTLRLRDPERANVYLILRNFLLCRGIKPNVIYLREKRRILLNELYNE